MTPILRLKTGKEKPIRNHHHWIFSGAVDSLPNVPNGSMIQVVSQSGECMGSAYINRQSSILGRMIAFGETDPHEAIRESIRKALLLRNTYLPLHTTGYRLINGEGDGLPGLIVDRYGDILVLQISTLGMEQLKPLILEELTRLLSPKGIYEKSLLPSRKEEGLAPFSGLLAGVVPDQLTFTEHGLKFIADPIHGQKTGFFLDQREMRQWVRELSKVKRVLNAFSYTGGFSVYAAAGGAVQVDSVDISEDAIALAKQNMQLNGYLNETHQFYAADVFEFLRKPLNYDLIILDPPAFAKRAKDVMQACRGYKEINRQAMEKMPPQSLLLTCSCSYHVDEALFQKVLFQAAIEAKRTVRIIGKHRQAIDHPVNLFHPEGNYLKSFLLAIE
jgi:23S rRNA (cytosine1962-C5)-methyltransferase